MRPILAGFRRIVCPNPLSTPYDPGMKAMVLERVAEPGGELPLRERNVPDPVPGAGEIVVRVAACGVCHTELDEIEGRTPPPTLPVVPGHQVVGRVAIRGEGAERFEVGERVGVAWIFSACGTCRFCRAGNENLCPEFVATGRDVDGGYAELVRVPESFAHRIPDSLGDLAAAPLLCAGAVGYRALRLTGLRDGESLGLTGFGASGHLVLGMARHLLPASPVHVFARNPAEREFALELGAVWAGDTSDHAPRALDAIIDTTPAWKPVVAALESLAPGGRLVINAIRKEDGDRDRLMELDYPRHLWLEKEVKSVANVTREDVQALLALSAEARLEPEVRTFALRDAAVALREMREGRIRGANVLLPG